MTPRFWPAALFVLSQWAGAQESVTFHWNPPDGARWLEHTVATKQRLRMEEPVRTEITETTAEVSVRRTATGWIVSSTPLAHVFTLNGRKVDPPVLEPLRKVALDFILDPEGKAVKVVGYARAAAELAAMAARMGKPIEFDMREFAQRDRDRWQALRGALSGVTVETGEIWEADGRFRPTPEITLPFTVSTHYAGYTTYRGRPCYRIETRFRPRDEPRAPGKVTGHGERLIDPDTLFIYHEREERRARLAARTLSVDPATLVERREYEATMLSP
ncbi:hypothetical protein HS125_00280 [bacterium]|nr:hypothetical protein [bacterium]